MPSRKTIARTLRAGVAALHILSPFGIQPVLAANAKLPPPAVSRALDAILLPIDKNVAKEFKLAKRKGLLVLAVQPGGVADKQGIKPGDVLTEIGGRRVSRPIDVDFAVRSGLKKGNSNYSFNVNRAGTAVVVAAVITLALYEEAFSVSSISTWDSWSYSSFSYSEFVSEYSQTIESSYESEETTIDKTLTQEESTTDEATVDSDGDGTPDAQDTDDDNDGVPDAQDDDDNNDGISDSTEGDDDGDAGGDDGADDGGDDAGGDDGGDDSGGDDAGGDDSGGDDSGGDDGGDDSGGDDGGGDE